MQVMKMKFSRIDNSIETYQIRYENVNNIINIDLIDQMKNLKNNADNLEIVAEYCIDTYLKSNATEKTHVYNQTKSYTAQSLASLAYQINELANSFLQIFDDTTFLLDNMSNSIKELNHQVVVHKEKLARREIGGISSNKILYDNTEMIKKPEIEEKSTKYSRKPIDYSQLDDIGHGVKLMNSNQFEYMNKVRLDKRLNSSYSSSHSSSLSGLNTSSNDLNNMKQSNSNIGNHHNEMLTPPLTLKSHTIMNINNSAGKASIRSNLSSSYYRTPIIPPSVPSEYLSRQELGIYSSRKEMGLNNTQTNDMLSSSFNVTMDLYTQI
jgi:hypothetical protein